MLIELAIWLTWAIC